MSKFLTDDISRIYIHVGLVKQNKDISVNNNYVFHIHTWDPFSRGTQTINIRNNNRFWPVWNQTDNWKQICQRDIEFLTYLLANNTRISLHIETNMTELNRTNINRIVVEIYDDEMVTEYISVIPTHQYTQYYYF